MNTGKIIIICCIIFLSVSNVFAQSEDSLEERVAELEQQIEEIKELLSKLNLTLELNNSEALTNFDVSVNALDSSPLAVELVALVYHKSGVSNNYANDYQDWISFTFTFTNSTEKAIQAAKGTIVFMDVFGEEWWRIGLTLNESINPGEAISWSGQINYDGYNDSHQTAKYMDAADVTMRYDVAQLMFADGTKVTLD